MFNSTRQESFLYVIDKKSPMRYYTVTNLKVSAPYPEFKTAFPMPGAPMFVDIEGTDGNLPVKFTKLPASQQVHEFNGVFITESRDALQAELEAMRKRSMDELDSRGYHEAVVAFCDNTLPLVNPEIARSRDNDNRLHSLESQLGEMKNTMSEMSEILKSLKTPQQ